MGESELRKTGLHQKLLTDEQLITDVSTLQHRDTELQGQLQNLRQENARINARMNQIQITRNMEWTLQLPTSNIELDRLQAEALDLRNSVGRSQSTKHPDASLKFEGGKE